MTCELGVVHGASGSARLRDGDTSVLCVVHGPRSSQNQNSSLDGLQFDCEVKFAQYVDVPVFSTHFPALGGYPGAAGAPGAAELSALSAAPSSTCAQARTSVERILSDSLREALVGMIRQEQAPKMVVTVCVSVLLSSGNLGVDLGSAITGCSLALADASVEMYDLVVASTAGCFVPTDGSSPRVAIASTAQPLGRGSGSGRDMGSHGAASSYLTVASRCNAPEMTQLWSEGRTPLALVHAMVECAVLANAAKRTQVHAVLLRKLQQQRL